MSDPDNSNHAPISDAQKDVLGELRRNNELLEKLLDIQSNVQKRQRKFWFMGMFQMALLVLFLLWIGSGYGF
jgi:hypothetical protein